MAGGAETPNIAALPAIARLGTCESARGPDADRHVKLLIQFAVKGSLSGAYSQCVACHDKDGKNKFGFSPLFGGGKITDISAGMKTIANFWPYSTTLFDFIRRGMPWQQPKSLTDDEVYALSAFILAKNKLIGETDTMNPETLPKVRMPNRGGFIMRFPDRI